MKPKFITALAIAVFMAMFTSCCVHRPSAKETTDSTTGITAVSDSILEIINKGRITALNHSLFMSKGDSVVALDSKEAAVVRFLLLNPDNFASDAPSFSLFVPSVDYKFRDGKRTVSASCDFGSGKWIIEDANGKRLMTRDLKSSELLRFTRSLFPTDSLLIKISGK